MVRNVLGAATLFVLLALDGVFAGHASSHRSRLVTRQSDSILQRDHQNGDAAPGARPGDAPGQNIMINNNGGQDSNSQRPGCESIFIGTAAVGGSFTTGWSEMPQVVGFDIKRDLPVGDGVTMPYLVEAGKDASKIKRALIVQPGLPRDYWKYTNLLRNSLLCASLNSTADIDLSTILISAPAWLIEGDISAGSGQQSDLRWAGGGWATGAVSSGPGDTRMSSFEVLDKMTEKFFNQAEYPALTSVYVVGHSLGGALTQRYAMVRKPSENDANMGFFPGNPGAYVWPVTDRPIENPSDTSCAAQRDDYAYGLSNLNAYARDAKREDIVSRYAARKVVYGLGLSDNEQGDTHCEAGYQGTSHLTKGQNFEKALATLPGGMPSSHHFNYVANVAHIDYLILSDPVSQYYLFKEGVDVRAGATSNGNGASPSSSASPSRTKSGNSAGPTGSNAASSGSSSSAISTRPASLSGIGASALACVGAAIVALL